MRQKTLCVPLEVKPASCSQLSALVTEFRLKIEKQNADYKVITSGVPSLHFMSMSVFTHAEFDPIFVLEANFDGTTTAFWEELTKAFEERLREILRCCKRPLDDDAELYDAVTKPDSKTPVARYFKARTQRPSVFHHGNRGLSRDRILSDDELFGAVREEIDGPKGKSPYRGLEPEAARALLRQRLLPKFSWLNEPAPRRIGISENLGDYARLLIFAVTIMLVLSLPGIIIAPLLALTTYLVGVGLLSALLIAQLYRLRRGLPGKEVPAAIPTAPFQPSWLFLYALIFVVYVVLTTLLLTPFVVATDFVVSWLNSIPPRAVAKTVRLTTRAVALGFVSTLVIVPLLLLRIRYLERHDSSRDAPEIDEQKLRAMIRREDWIAQNHMSSIVLIKPGMLRSLIIQAGHLGLGLLLRVQARNGYLGNMRTVHFAHWAFLNNGSRLLFLSNFDHGWDSYLDDFIEKAAQGLTIAWGSGVGFPAARFLIFDGAAHGRHFKNWALASRTVSRFWYSAYRELTVDQIERNHRIANGLRPKRMSADSAVAWMRDL